MSRLEHLRHALETRVIHFAEMNECGLRALDKSIVAIYEDCIALGEGLAALEILHQHRQPVSSV